MSFSDAPPQCSGMDQARLEQVTRWLDQQVSLNRLAGASVLVAHKGSTALCQSTGTMQRDSIVRLYSMTKPVTTVAAMILYERGHFQLDDPIALYLPEFADTPVWNGAGSSSQAGSGIDQGHAESSNRACSDARGEHRQATGAASTENDADAVLSQVEPQRSPMTVHQLMTHTAGLTYDFMQETPVDAWYRAQGLRFPGADESLESLVKRLAKAPLVSQPGTAWHYSVSTDVLGRLVEIWSGLSLAAFFEQEIFAPLGMTDTGFHVPPGKAERFADLYWPAEGGELGATAVQLEPMAALKARMAQLNSQRAGLQPPVVLEPAAGSSFLKPPALLSGGGGLIGTLDDYARFCQMLLNGGELEGTRVLGRKSVESMRCNHLPDGRDMAAMGQSVWSESTYAGVGFGLGFAVVIDPVKAQIITSKGEHHWGGAASTFFWIDPEEELYVVFLTQLFPSSAYPFRRELRTAVYQALAS